MEIMDKMDIFDEAHKNSPMFKVFRQYMRMVLEMLMFLRAVHIADWEVHLKALEIRYLRSISSLIIDWITMYAEFKDGNWEVNKNPRVPFCTLGADNSLEHINRSS